MQKSLFSKYYSICVMMILVSIALIGSVFLILTSNYFEQEKLTFFPGMSNRRYPLPWRICRSMTMTMCPPPGC